LQLSKDRVLFYGFALICIGLLPLLTIPHFFTITAYHEDWGNFWAAGATAGGRTLLDPRLHAAWQTAHHMRPQAFAYPPGVAWFYAPFARLSPMSSFFIDQSLMVGACFIAALLVARIYRFAVWFAIAAVFAWVPLLYGIFVGQSTPIALVIFLVAILALVDRRPVLAGLAAGILLFKPTDAVVLIALMALRRQWRSLAIVFACGIVWYLISVAATADNWAWPIEYARSLQGYYLTDFSTNAVKAFSLPMVLMYAGVPQTVGLAAAAALFLACVPLLLRAPMLEASSVAPLITLALSPHAWPYDVGLLIPALCFFMLVATEPWRTRIIAGVYIIAVLPLMHFDPLAIVVLGGMALWLGCAAREQLSTRLS
jgi:Glycosyltransferase family 87